MSGSFAWITGDKADMQVWRLVSGIKAIKSDRLMTGVLKSCLQVALNESHHRVNVYAFCISEWLMDVLISLFVLMDIRVSLFKKLRYPRSVFGLTYLFQQFIQFIVCSIKQPKILCFIKQCRYDISPERNSLAEGKTRGCSHAVVFAAYRPDIPRPFPE